MPRPPTWDHLKSTKKPLEVRIPVYLDDEPIERLEKLREELEAARVRDKAIEQQMRLSMTVASGANSLDLGPSEDVLRLEAEVEAAEEAVRESTAWFVLRKPSPKGRKRYEALIEAHPPSDEQVAEATKDGRDRPQYNAETFAPALLSMTCAEPLLTVEEATELFDDWSVTECTELFTACLAVNTGRRTVDLGKG